MCRGCCRIEDDWQRSGSADADRGPSTSAPAPVRSTTTSRPSVYARTLAEDVVKDGETLAAAGIDLGDVVVIGALFAAGVDSVKIRSVLNV